MANNFRYGIDHLTTSKTIALANGELKGILDKEAIKKIETSKHYVEQIVADEKTVYGINTGFGILANTKISAEDTATLQHKILQSHSVGVGDPIPIEVASIMLITKCIHWHKVFPVFNYQHLKESSGILIMILYPSCPRRVVLVHPVILLHWRIYFFH